MDFFKHCSVDVLQQGQLFIFILTAVGLISSQLELFKQLVSIPNTLIYKMSNRFIILLSYFIGVYLLLIHKLLFKDIFFECNGILKVLDNDIRIIRSLKLVNCSFHDLFFSYIAVYCTHASIEKRFRAGSDSVESCIHDQLGKLLGCALIALQRLVDVSAELFSFFYNSLNLLRDFGKLHFLLLFNRPEQLVVKNLVECIGPCSKLVLHELIHLIYLRRLSFVPTLCCHPIKFSINQFNVALLVLVWETIVIWVNLLVFF